MRNVDIFSERNPGSVCKTLRKACTSRLALMDTINAKAISQTTNTPKVVRRLLGGVVHAAVPCSDPRISTAEAWRAGASPNSKAAAPVITTQKTAKRQSREKVIHCGITTGIRETIARRH